MTTPVHTFSWHALPLMLDKPDAVRKLVEWLQKWERTSLKVMGIFEREVTWADLYLFNTLRLTGKKLLFSESDLQPIMEVLKQVYHADHLSVLQCALQKGAEDPNCLLKAVVNQDQIVVMGWLCSSIFPSLNMQQGWSVLLNQDDVEMAHIFLAKTPFQTLSDFNQMLGKAVQKGAERIAQALCNLDLELDEWPSPQELGRAFYLIAKTSENPDASIRHVLQHSSDKMSIEQRELDDLFLYTVQSKKNSALVLCTASISGVRVSLFMLQRVRKGNSLDKSLDELVFKQILSYS